MHLNHRQFWLSAILWPQRFFKELQKGLWYEDNRNLRGVSPVCFQNNSGILQWEQTDSQDLCHGTNKHHFTTLKWIFPSVFSSRKKPIPKSPIVHSFDVLCAGTKYCVLGVCVTETKPPSALPHQLVQYVRALMQCYHAYQLMTQYQQLVKAQGSLGRRHDRQFSILYIKSCLGNSNLITLLWVLSSRSKSLLKQIGDDIFINKHPCSFLESIRLVFLRVPRFVRSKSMLGPQEITAGVYHTSLARNCGKRVRMPQCKTPHHSDAVFDGTTESTNGWRKHTKANQEVWWENNTQ